MSAFTRLWIDIHRVVLPNVRSRRPSFYYTFAFPKEPFFGSASLEDISKGLELVLLRVLTIPESDTGRSEGFAGNWI